MLVIEQGVSSLKDILFIFKLKKLKSLLESSLGRPKSFFSLWTQSHSASPNVILEVFLLLSTNLISRLVRGANANMQLRSQMPGPGVTGFIAP
jgi:hypothetical protein